MGHAADCPRSRVGALFTIGIGFFQFSSFGHFMARTFGSLFKKEEHDVGSGHVSAFTAIATAIGGAVGVGNIGGVATAIAVGGPGPCSGFGSPPFWAWL